MGNFKEFIKELSTYIGYSLKILFKWIIFGILTGVIVGTVATVFYHCLTFVTEYRQSHSIIFFGLPIGGLLIVVLYKLMGKDPGTDKIISAVRTEEEIPFLMAPLIFVSTTITHLFGASAGREGAALQLGGSIADKIGKVIKLEGNDRRIIIMCGMSAGFSAIFGTPMSAAFFAIEIISVGIMQYAALVPCVLSSFVARILAKELMVVPEGFTVHIKPEFTIKNFILIVLISIGFGLVSTFFCMGMHGMKELYVRKIENPYLRIFVAGIVIIGLTLVLNTTDYMGAGMDVVERVFEEPAKPYMFILKILFTALALGAGFKGGEIVPAFYVGATFGSMLAPLMNMRVDLAAACGMIGVFCGVTNCPITALLIGFELFGFECMPYYVISVAVSYMMSGYYSLYHEQKFAYSKYETKYIDRRPL